ncbi:MAG: hypothetical protein AVDCRST_MAG36-1291 [uncultured Nocardioidaceae bacterium]|uniref:DUF559 domain-containing protein n=1 Tax=uncultured Nocardioidaceae bacterium TaxID=253824 RepID=A0A6J4LS61_9ACTN|nr:MAG: hypothetical protein AVDCRST_MAG36-1291 [uncultured Nocardioidaceae bacterium]
MWRASYFDGRGPSGREELPVALAVGSVPGRRSVSGTVLSYEVLDLEDVVEISGVPVLRPVPALFHELRRPQPWREAVVALDMAAAARLSSTPRLREHLRAHRHWRRAARVGRVLEHAGRDSRSPGETRLRLVWTVDAGLPPPWENRALYDLDGRLVCIPDLFDEVAGLVAEYDGAEHLTLGRRVHDDAREEACRRLGLEYARFTGPDVRDTGRAVRRLLTARSRALFLPPGARGWTLEPPSTGWAGRWRTG